MAEFIFNTSFYVPATKVEIWQQWVKTQLLFGVESAMPHIKAEVFEVLSQTASENLIFSVQWRCSSSGEVEQLDECLACELQALVTEFGEQVTHFSSVMKKTME